MKRETLTLDQVAKLLQVQYPDMDELAAVHADHTGLHVTYTERQEGLFQEEILYSLKCKAKQNFLVTRSIYDRYVKRYPNMDHAREFEVMVDWCEANTRKRKQHKSMHLFINGWFERNVNKARQDEAADDGYYADAK